MKNPDPRSHFFLSGVLSALGATLIWSGNFIVARGLVDIFPPVQLAFFRWLTALMVLLPFGWPFVAREKALILNHLGYLALVALLGVSLFNTLLYVAGRYTTALNMALIATLTPVFIVFLARVFLRESVTPRKGIGVAVAVFGAVSLVTRGDYGRLLDLDLNFGDLLMLLAAFLFAAYSILVGEKPRGMSPMAFLTAIFSLGFLFLVPGALWESRIAGPILWSPAVFGAILYVGIGASLVSFILWNRAVAQIGAAMAGCIYYSLPLFSGIEALLILGEPVTFAHLYSGLCIIGGIFIATSDRLGFGKKA